MSSWEHLQNVLMQVHNRIVRDEFRDVEGDDDNISTSRSSLRSASLIRDSDSATTVLNRFFLFYVMLRKASDMHPALYTTPVDRFQQTIEFQPQVTLYFKEDIEDVEPGYAPLDAQLSFRIKNESGGTTTEAELRNIATRIRTEFATGNGYRWRKGRVQVNYRDTRLGYRLLVQAFSDSEGKKLIRKVMDLQGDAPDGSRFTLNLLDQTPPTVPPTRTIVGKPRRLPRRRPVGWVRFQWAEAHIWGLQNGIILLDRTGRRRNPLITAR